MKLENVAQLLREPPSANETIGPGQLSSLIAQEGATVIDLSTSPHYRRGHIPGAWFAIRGRLDRAAKKIHITGTLVLTSEDGLLANLATGGSSHTDGRPNTLA